MVNSAQRGKHNEYTGSLIENSSRYNRNDNRTLWIFANGIQQGERKRRGGELSSERRA
jgi:hypothetical protein